MKTVSIEEVLKKAAEIEKLPGRSDASANIVRAYRELTGANLKTALNWLENS